MIKRILLVVVTLVALNITKTYAQGDPPTEKQLEREDGKHKGLQLDRTELIKRLMHGDSTLNFTEQKSGGDMPVLIAHGINNSIVKITGTEDNIRKLTYQVFVIPDNAKSVQNEFIIAGMSVGAVLPDKRTMNWLFKIYDDIKASPSTEIKQSYSLTGNLFSFVYDPIAKTIIITISTEYN